MLGNPHDSTTTTVKPYAPPNQRNRLNRRKSGDRSERTNNPYGNDGEKNQVASSRNVPIIDHGEGVSSNLQHENLHPKLIAIDGCCSSEAAQLLNDRWAAAMHSYKDQSIDSSEKPVMYSGAGASAWGHSRLPHPVDFLAELRRAIHNANASVDA